MLQDHLQDSFAVYRSVTSKVHGENVRGWATSHAVRGRAGKPKSRIVASEQGERVVVTRTLVAERDADLRQGDALKIDGQAYRVVSVYAVRDLWGVESHREAALEELREVLP